MTECYLVQCIDSTCCEKINVKKLYFGFEKEEAKRIFKEHTSTFIKELLNYHTQEQINEFVEENETYFDFCDNDGDNIVFMLEKLEG